MNSRQKEKAESENNTPLDLANIFASLERIRHRLDKLESGVDLRSEISNPRLTHPSQQKFTIAEAIADAIFDGVEKKKACTFEPNGKPCDHCAMCSSLGF